MGSNGRIALVTGAGSGIGRAVSLTLQSAGYSVALEGRRAGELERTADLAAPAGGEMLVAPTDVGDPESVRGLFATIRKTFGRLDVLVNNAGIGAPGIPMEGLNFEQWSAPLETNVQFITVMATQMPFIGRG
jgi:NAD(P)-dependent dehydrogenase (short-subunit alcohol dehydrogenase family)